MVAVKMREFQRNLRKMKRLVKRGEPVLIKDQNGEEYLFQKIQQTNPLWLRQRGTVLHYEDGPVGVKWNAER